MADRKTPSLRRDFTYFETMTTRWNDNDIYGHMNNSIHYGLFDSIVNSWLIRHGGQDWRSAPSIGLVVHSSCDYYAELGYPEPIVAGMRVDRLGTSSVTYRIGLFTEHGESCAAEGGFVHVYVDRLTRRSTAIDPALRKAMEGLLPSDVPS